jgi:hypothetical protein
MHVLGSSNSSQRNRLYPTCAGGSGEVRQGKISLPGSSYRIPRLLRRKKHLGANNIPNAIANEEHSAYNGLLRVADNVGRDNGHADRQDACIRAHYRRAEEFRVALGIVEDVD